MNNVSSMPHKTLSTGAKISVIDSDPYFLHLYTVILRRAGHQVTALLSAGDFDWSTVANVELLILDIVILDTGGLAFIDALKRKRTDINILLAASLKTHGVSDRLDSLADLEVQIRGIVYKPFIADYLTSEVERCMDPRQNLAYTRHSLELLDQSILRDEFVVNYKPLYCIDTKDTALIHVDPYLLANEGAMVEEDYAFIMFNSSLSAAYLKYLIDKVIVESVYIPGSKEHPFMIKVPIFALSHSHLREFLISLLKKSESMGVEIVIAVDDSEYCINGEASRPLISEMKREGCRMALHNTRYSRDSSTSSMLSNFDYVHLDPEYGSPNDSGQSTTQPHMPQRGLPNFSTDSNSVRFARNAAEVPQVPAVFVTCTIAAPYNHRRKQLSDLSHE